MSEIERIQEIEEDWLRKFQWNLFEDIDPSDLVNFIKISMNEVIADEKIEADSMEKIELYDNFEKRINKLDLEKLETEIEEYLNEIDHE